MKTAVRRELYASNPDRPMMPASNGKLAVSAAALDFFGPDYTFKTWLARGGTSYRDTYKDQLSKHVLAMESDDGVLPIEGYDFAGTPKARETIAQIVRLLAPVGGTTLNEGFNGADITPMVNAAAIPAMSPDVDMRRYFYLHHTPADTVDKVDANEMARVTAAMATIAYIVAELPDALDRAPVPQAK